LRSSSVNLLAACQPAACVVPLVPDVTSNAQANADLGSGCLVVRCSSVRSPTLPLRTTRTRATLETREGETDQKQTCFPLSAICALCTLCLDRSYVAFLVLTTLSTLVSRDEFLFSRILLSVLDHPHTCLTHLTQRTSRKIQHAVQIPGLQRVEAGVGSTVAEQIDATTTKRHSVLRCCPPGSATARQQVGRASASAVRDAAGVHACQF